MLIITGLLMSIFLQRMFFLYNLDSSDPNRKIQQYLTRREISHTKLKMSDNKSDKFLVAFINLFLLIIYIN